MDDTSWPARFYRALAFPFVFIRDQNVTRLVAMGMSLWMTWDSYAWAKHYAEIHPEKSGAEIGLIIGAVLAAVSALQGYTFKLYLEDRQKD